MDNSVWFALIAAISGAVTAIVAPIALAVVNNRNRRIDKEHDYARQDAMVAKSDEVARLLAIATSDSAEAARSTSQKLDEIHTLVNSNMTAAMQAELDATTRDLASMMEVVELKKAAGRDPSVTTLAAIEATRIRIGELQSALSDRLSDEQKVRRP